MITLSQQTARRLAVRRQLLDRPQPPLSSEGVLETVRRLGCLQIDPIRAVERTQYLVLWSRLGNYPRQLLDDLLFEDRLLFEYWAHAASIVLTENYPIHRIQMERARRGREQSRAWIEKNVALRQHIFDRIAELGSVSPADLEDHSVSGWESSGWTSGRTVTQMLSYLWLQGRIMVSQRQGSRKRYRLHDDHLPQYAATEPIEVDEVVRRAVLIAVGALGVATPTQIRNHFVRGHYPNLEQTLQTLNAEELLTPVEVAGWSGRWYTRSDLLPEIERLQHEFDGRTTLLSPFDNLICDRKRTELLWDFSYRIEIYVPAAKREYGYYVLPVLHGSDLIGRIAPRIDHKKKRMVINGVYAEADAPRNDATAAAVAAALSDLVAWSGVREVIFNREKPLDWPVDQLLTL